MTAEPKCFISYSWDSTNQQEWVRAFATRLTENGVVINLDQWDVSLGDQLPRYMEKSIRESDFVLIICTPTYASKANAGKGGVGYETGVVTGEIFGEAASERKFIPVLRGDPVVSLPSYLKSKAYIDFRNDSEYEINLESLLRHIYGEPRFKRPKPGKKPNFEDTLQKKKNAVQIDIAKTSIKPDLDLKTASWLQIWSRAFIRPDQQFFAEILQARAASDFLIYIWFFIAGVFNIATYSIYKVTTNLVTNSPISGMDLFKWFVISPPIGGIIQIVILVIIIAMVQWSSRLLGGTSNYNKTLNSFSIITVPYLFIYGIISIFMAIPQVDIISMIVGIILGMYYLFLQVLMLKAANQFSWWKAIGCVVIPTVILSVISIGLSIVMYYTVLFFENLGIPIEYW